MPLTALAMRSTTIVIEKYKVYTDTDSDGKTEIITDLNVKFQGKPLEMEVKVDPGAETNCIPLSHFRYLFPELCNREGQPLEEALTPSLAQFEAYDGGIMKAHMDGSYCPLRTSAEPRSSTL